jgi:hypothetical protein
LPAVSPGWSTPVELPLPAVSPGWRAPVSTKKRLAVQQETSAVAQKNHLLPKSSGVVEAPSRKTLCLGEEPQKKTTTACAEPSVKQAIAYGKGRSSGMCVSVHYTAYLICAVLVCVCTHPIRSICCIPRHIFTRFDQYVAFRGTCSCTHLHTCKHLHKCTHIYICTHIHVHTSPHMRTTMQTPF